jgi:hypothetical protein
MSYLKERNIVDKWVYLLVHQNNGNKLEIVPPYQPIVTNFFDDNREENRYFIHYNNEQREIYKPFDTEIGATKSLLRRIRDFYEWHSDTTGSRAPVAYDDVWKEKARKTLIFLRNKYGEQHPELFI